jgi:hypothetical protein
VETKYPPNFGDPKFTWRAWPARERPGKALLASAIVLAFAALIASWLILDGVSPPLSILAGAGALIVLFLALNRFFLVSRFEIDEKGVTAHHPLRGRARRIEWLEVRRFHQDAHGGYLSRRAVASRFDPWQGMHILWGMERERAVEAIRAHLDAASEEHRLRAQATTGNS